MNQLFFDSMGPRVTYDYIELWTQRTGIGIPKEYSKFLVEFSNGGAPGGRCCFNVPGLDDQDPNWQKWHGCLGIAHPLRYYDLEYMQDDHQSRFGQFEFGDDEGGNVLVIHTSIEPIGQVSFIDLEDGPYEGDKWPKLWFVAKSFTEFVSSLKTSDEVFDW